MKLRMIRGVSAVLTAACAASVVGCYPAYGPASYSTGYGQDAKGYAVPQESYPAQQPRPAGVDPGLAIAGAAAAGLLGYAIGNNQGNRYYHGGGYYRPVPYYGGYHHH